MPRGAIVLVDEAGQIGGEQMLQLLDYVQVGRGRIILSGDITDKHLLIESNNRIRPVPFKDLERVTVCQPKELSLSTGDRLQLKANDKSQDGRKLANGELVTVKEPAPQAHP
ncbi:MAG: hypothetical protein KGJ60_11850 [Verrucomicrobiota bacterium]|nr:hypothetical protein [Verrucomicrobiota bacterium]